METDDLEDVSDDEFDQILEEKEKGWEKRIDQIDYSLATSKQRKQIKKRQNRDGSDEDLDEEEVDLGKIYRSWVFKFLIFFIKFLQKSFLTIQNLTNPA